jgi:hypothetical protein
VRDPLISGLRIYRPGVGSHDTGPTTDIDSANGSLRAGLGPPGGEPAGSGLHGSMPRYDGSAGRAGPAGPCHKPDRAVRVESGSVAGSPFRQSGGDGRARPAGTYQVGSKAGPDRME